jgi:hypothetical protein
VIKISYQSQPIVWQVDKQYLLPAQSGQVRWNGNTKEFEVCDNNSGNWYRINPEIELRNDPELADVFAWAKRKMHQEHELEKLMREYPAVKDAKEKLDIILKLVQDGQSS